MATIHTLAAEFDTEPYAIQALCNLDVEQSGKLTDEQEAFVRDLLTHTDDDGVYRA